MRHRTKVLRATVIMLAHAAVLQAHAAPGDLALAQQLADLSLEELGNLEVTSVSGRAENLQRAAASIFVITAQDIRRSGATSLPGALRLAPNLQVAQTSAGQWAISARGFQDLIANKLLVLIDGRTIYSALFAGVFWDANDVVLEDVERIEVISGPGGTIWGANAVNGVINVVTRRSTDTQGTLLSVTRSGQGGREVARWGTALGESGHLRIYGLAVDRGNTRLPSGIALADASSRNQVGFRGDWGWGPSTLTVQGDAYRGGDTPANSLAPLIHGGNLQARWRSTFADGSAYTVQAIHDVANRDDVDLFINRVATTDLQFSHEAKVPVGQLLWGAGYRSARDTSAPTALVLFNPVERKLAWTNVFAQYQWPLARQLQLTAGLKLERNSYTGVEQLPSLRLAWEHSETATTWAAASRAVRAPARIDRDFYFPGAAPFVIAGGPNFQSEVANVYELGHRAQPSKNLQWSGTLFRDEYKGLRSGLPGQPLPNTVENLVQGHIHGLEAWGAWQATPTWRLAGGFLAMQKRLHYCCGISPATTDFPGLGVDASTQWSLRSSHDFGHQVELDLMVRRVGALSGTVPSYISLDAQLARQVSPQLRVALIARNLFNPRHVEYLSTGSGGAPDSQFGRRWMLQARWDL
ncbi:TonB-dependent receptor plug domain-containing protein [Caenimonas aquaedulcis]|uniref:TonB-dependent receptor n=1 Tax=Caenimonas aquaedulcis TaxID=2793270 RepID=A0A931MJT0_9BURK|nr:TonB-dependent receptor [Caenimonas aquaedulcis]MBG9390635.1 TonB-dependent receptor [Caenimonas aquaedulcis]